jgi:hypothetical protein
MNADQQLKQACDEWRRLAEAEGEAIQRCNWSLLAACQKSLQNLQQRITQFSKAARADWKKLGAARVAKEKELRAAIRELMSLEHRNSTLLTAVRHGTHQRLEQLHHASRKLSRIQHSHRSKNAAAQVSFF